MTIERKHWHRMSQKLATVGLLRSGTLSGNSCTLAKKLPVLTPLTLSNTSFYWLSKDYPKALGLQLPRSPGSFVFGIIQLWSWSIVSSTRAH